MNADASVRAAEEKSEATIIGLRPQASDRAPATSIETANEPVVTDIDRLLTAALMLNSRANSGINGCRQYIKAKVENPAANSAMFVRRNAAVPRLTFAATGSNPRPIYSE